MRDILSRIGMNGCRRSATLPLLWREQYGLEVQVGTHTSKFDCGERLHH